MLPSTGSQLMLVGFRAHETVGIAMLSCVSTCKLRINLLDMSTSSPHWHTIVHLISYTQHRHFGTLEIEGSK